MLFSPSERARLLRTPGIGMGVIQRLEAAGYHSIEQLQRQGVDRVVAQLCRELRTPAWLNRARALRAAIAEEDR